VLNAVYWTIDGATDRMEWGYTIKKTMGYPDDEVGSDVDWFHARIHPADREPFVDTMGTAIKSCGQWSGEFRFRRADGVYIPFRCSARAICGPDGKLQQTIGAMAQMTEAKTHATSHAGEFQALFESAPGLYLVLRPEDFRIVAVSDAYLRATMTEHSRIIGKTLFEVFPDDPTDPYADGVRNLRASLERVRATRLADVMAVQRYPIPRPESLGGGFEERWWSPINSPVLGNDGQISFIIHRVEDVTPFIQQMQQEGKEVEGLRLIESRAQHMAAEILLRGQELQLVNEQLRQVQKKLQAANRELKDFASIVSHDLKSPLRAVATLASWIQTDYADKVDEEGRENLAEMRKRLARMDRMIDGILDYSRVGRIDENYEPVPLQETLAEVIRDLNPPRDAEINIDSGLPVISGNPVRVRQLFQNLIGNALKHGRRTGLEIRVSCVDLGTVWRFGVTDHGPGIEERHVERIFKMFQTLAPKDKTDSTGIGLAIAKRIVEQAGGRIWVESQPGHGSTFHFTWPKQVAADKELRESADSLEVGSVTPQS